MLLENSNTKINLMKAFAGESQARNRYIISASQARKEKLNIIEKVFIFTANQEQEHAKVFYKFLAPICGNKINISGDFPIDLYNNTLDMLKCAKNNEYEEYSNVYKSFGDEAKSEGFIEISEVFYNIAKVEKVHSDRFDNLIKLIQNNNLFKSEKEQSWVCLNCGYVHIGNEVPGICPVCEHSRGYFCTDFGF